MTLHKLFLAVLSVLVLISTTPAEAGMIPTDSLLTDLQAQEMRADRVAQVEAFLARDDVRQQLEALGVDPAAATERVAALTDAELQQLANHVDDAPSGGHLLELVLVIFLILILLDLLGVTNIFPRI